MIAKGNLHGDGGKLARYLLTGEKDEIAEFVEARRLDYLSRDPVQAFEMLQRVAEANTKADYPFFHVQTRNPNGDKHLTDAAVVADCRPGGKAPRPHRPAAHCQLSYPAERRKTSACRMVPHRS